jgi:PAS domain S-box-containing protein
MDKVRIYWTPELIISSIYINFGLLWIFFSDQFLPQFQTNKGFAYVFLTGVLLFFLVRNFNRSVQNQRIHYHLLFEENPMPLWNCDSVSGAILESNQAACQKYGYSKSEFAQMKIDELEIGTQTSARSAWTSKCSNAALQHRHRNGRVFDVELHFHKLESNEILIVAYDLQEHKKIENLLFSEKKSLEYFKNTIQSASVFALLDTQSRVQEANANLIRLSGLSQNELLGRRLGGLWRSQKPEWSHLIEQLEKGIQCKAEMQLPHGWINYQLLKYHQEGQNPAYLLLGQDASEQKRVQQELWALTSALVERNQELSQYSYLISHNLRTPAANILGLVELLKAEQIEATEEEKIAEKKIILENITLSALQMENDLQTLNLRLDSEKNSNNQRTIIDLKTVIDTILAEVYQFIPEPKWRPELKLEIKEIVSIAPYVHSILFNLISNALKFQSPDRPLKLTIHSFKKENQWAITLQDNGLGIDLAAHGKQIFGIYQRFHPHIEGNGMGLYLVKTQIEMLGGQINLQSNIQAGSLFQLTFPILEPISEKTH